MSVISAVNAARAPHPVKVMALTPEPLGLTNGALMPAAFWSARTLSAIAEVLMSDMNSACASCTA